MALAFDDRAPTWKDCDWGIANDLRNLKIVDPACGSGTLLVAALQEVLRRYRRDNPTGNEGQANGVKSILEHTLIGYDVIPGAVHLTSTALHLAETTRIVKDIPIHKMPHDVKDGMPRLGALDFLSTAPNHNNASTEELFLTDAFRFSNKGDIVRFGSEMPRSCDMFICNPPYTRAGGPGAAGYTEWNPLFGSQLSREDQSIMAKGLQRTLSKTPASMYAGLGSAFLVMANERLREGGRLAFVLPTALLTGSRWSAMRVQLLKDYDIDWVVVSHDPRTRTKSRNMPGRLFVAFSESTRIAETLIVCDKANQRRRRKRQSFRSFCKSSQPS